MESETSLLLDVAVAFGVALAGGWLATRLQLPAMVGYIAAGLLISPFTPGFVGDTENDDHPHADIRRGQNFIGRVVDAVVRSPQWSSTLLVITYDEWGGFFDTVRPPRFPDLVSNPGGDVTNPDHGQAGFRVPTFLVSPFTRKKKLTRTVFDHSAILKLVEWRFFGGLSVEEIARTLEVSERTVKRHWRTARAFLYQELSGQGLAP